MLNKKRKMRNVRIPASGVGKRMSPINLVMAHFCMKRKTDGAGIAQNAMALNVEIGNELPRL